MAVKSLLALALAASAATASIIPLETRDVASTFRLSATVVAHDLSPSVEGLELSYLAVDGCLSDLFFVPSGKGAAFSTDGDKVGLPHYSAHHNVFAAVLVTPGGSATVPSGFPVQLKCQDGTSGAANLLFSTELMACPGDDGVYLAAKQDGQRPLAACAQIKLVRKCDSNPEKIPGGADITCQA